MKTVLNIIALAISINCVSAFQAQASCSMSTIEIAKCEFGEPHHMKIVTLTNNSACGLDSIWYQHSGMDLKTNGSVDHQTHTVYRFENLRLVISNKSLEHLENGTVSSIKTSRAASLYSTNTGTKKLTSLGTVSCEAITAN